MGSGKNDASAGTSTSSAHGRLGGYCGTMYIGSSPWGHRVGERGWGVETIRFMSLMASRQGDMRGNGVARRDDEEKRKGDF